MAALVAPLVSALVLAQPTDPEAPTPPRPLRYLTLNVLHGGPWSGWFGNGGDLERRLDLVAEEIRALEVDVIGLQEASTSSDRGNVAERLAARLGFHWVYAPTTGRIFGSETVGRVVTALMNFSEGPAIISRLPIVAWAALELPRCGRVFEPRVLLHAELETPGGRLPVFSTHTRGDVCHTRPVAKLVRARRGRLPAVLMGDFNAAEDSPAVTALTGDAGFLDAYRLANPAAPGFTVWQRVDVPDRMVRRRVDYVFLVPGAAVPGRILGSRVVLDTPRRLENGAVLWPSDHYGVLAEIDVFPPAMATPHGR